MTNKKVHSISSPADVPRLVREVIGFEPTDSLVVIGLGGGVIARIDLGDVAVMAMSLQPAVPHLSNGAIVATYGPSGDVGRVVAAVLGVRVMACAHIWQGVATLGNQSEPYAGDGRTRADLATDVAAAVSDADEADDEATRAWRAGNGALAWAYLDRARELRGSHSDRGRELAHRLQTAQDPRECAS